MIRNLSFWLANKLILNTQNFTWICLTGHQTHSQQCVLLFSNGNWRCVAFALDFSLGILSWCAASTETLCLPEKQTASHVNFFELESRTGRLPTFGRNLTLARPRRRWSCRSRPRPRTGTFQQNRWRLTERSRSIFCNWKTPNRCLLAALWQCAFHPRRRCSLDNHLEIKLWLTTIGFNKWAIIIIIAHNFGFKL